MKLVWPVLLVIFLLSGFTWAQSPDKQIEEAHRLCEQGQIIAARNLLADTISRDTLAAVSLYCRGMLLEYEGYSWDALFLYIKAAPQDSGYLPAITAFTRLAIDLNMLPLARKMGGILLNRFPNDPIPYLTMASIEIGENRFDSAGVWMDQAAGQGLDSLDIALWRAEIAFRAGQDDDGFRWLQGLDQKNLLSKPRVSDESAGDLTWLRGQRDIIADRLSHLAAIYDYLNLPDSAVKYARAAWQRDSTNAPRGLRLGQYLMEYRRLKEAQQVADRLLGVTDGYGPAWILAAYIRRASGKPMEAEPLFFKFIELQPSSPVAYDVHADYLAAFDDRVMATLDQQTAFTIATNLAYPDEYLRVLFRKLMWLLAEVRDGISIREYTQESGDLADEPDRAFYEASAMRVYPEMVDTARDIIDKNLTANWDNKAWLSCAGPYFTYGGDWEKAARIFQRLLTFPYPREIDIVSLLHVYQKTSNTAAADSLAPSLPARFERSRRIREAFMILYQTAGRFDQATAYAEKLHRMTPDFLPYDTILVDLYVAQGKPDNARSILTEFVDRNPLDPAGHFHLAQFDFVHGRSDDLLMHADRCLALDSTYAAGYELKGLYFREKGKTDSAVVNLNRAAALQSDSPWAYYFLAEYYLGQGDSLIKAAGLGKSAVRYFGHDRRGLDLLGRIYLAQNKPKLAQIQFADGMKMFPDDPDFQFLMGKALALQGEKEKAVTFLDKAIQLGLKAPYREEARTLLSGLK